jgi:hypothetical protein
MSDKPFPHNSLNENSAAQYSFKVTASLVEDGNVNRESDVIVTVSDVVCVSVVSSDGLNVTLIEVVVDVEDVGDGVGVLDVPVL